MIGSEVHLDPALADVLERYWELREMTHPECGISTDGEDPIVASHLRAMDRAHFKARAEVLQTERDRLMARGRRH